MKIKSDPSAFINLKNVILSYLFLSYLISTDKTLSY